MSIPILRSTFAFLLVCCPSPTRPPLRIRQHPDAYATQMSPGAAVSPTLPGFFTSEVVLETSAQLFRPSVRHLGETQALQEVRAGQYVVLVLKVGAENRQYPLVVIKLQGQPGVQDSVATLHDMRAVQGIVIDPGLTDPIKTGR